MNRNQNRVHRIVRRNKRRRVIKAIESVFVVAVILTCVSFAGLKISAISINAKGSDTDSFEKRYKSVMVEQDDCLWNIADRYMSVGYTDKRSYVDEVRTLNNINSDEVHYGEYICVPYYQ